MPALRPLLAVGLFAVTAAFPPAASSQGAPALPAKPVCEKPDAYPRLGSENQKRAWQNGVRSWQDCLKKYIDDLEAQIAPAIKARQAAIDEFNAATKSFQEQIDAAK